MQNKSNHFRSLELNIPPGWSAGYVCSCKCGSIYTSQRQRACVYDLIFKTLLRSTPSGLKAQAWIMRGGLGNVFLINRLSGWRARSDPDFSAPWGLPAVCMWISALIWSSWDCEVERITARFTMRDWDGTQVWDQNKTARVVVGFYNLVVN